MVFALFLLLLVPLCWGLQPSTFFRRSQWNQVEFGGSLGVQSKIEGPAAVFSAFLSPSAVVSAAWDPTMIEVLEKDRMFRLRQEPLDFAGVMRVTTTVDVEVAQKSSGLALESRDIACMVQFDKRNEPTRLDVDIKLDGVLLPQKTDDAEINGSFDFTVKGTLQGPLLLLPDPALAAATRLVSLGIIHYAQDRFVKGLKTDFYKWQQDRRRAFDEKKKNRDNGPGKTTPPTRDS